MVNKLSIKLTVLIFTLTVVNVTICSSKCVQAEACDKKGIRLLLHETDTKEVPENSDMKLLLSELDMDELDDYVDFSEMFNDFISGNDGITYNKISDYLFDAIAGEIKSNAEMFVKLVIIGILSAFLSNFVSALKNNESAKTSYYIVYILTFAIIIAVHQKNILQTKETLELLNDFMGTLIPVLASTVVFCMKSMTAAMTYELVLFLIAAVSKILAGFVLPLINIYMAARITKDLLDEDMAAKFAGGIGKLLNMVMKGIVVFTAGLSTIKMLITPALDELTGTAVIKLAGSIPGISGALNSVAGTVLGAGNLIKNTVGVTGIAAVVIIAGLPVLKIFILSCMYRVAGFLTGYIAEGGFIKIVETGAKTTEFMLKTILCAAVMFILTIVVTIAATVPGV